MKKFLNVLGCAAVLAVAAVVGQAYGLFKAPWFDTAGSYGSSAVAWAKGGFHGSPTAGVVDPATLAAQAQEAAERVKVEFAQLVGESKRRAIAKYPDLAVANTEMNSRFVFRYNYLVKDASARLKEANWPESLADECAAAAKVTAKTLREKIPVKAPASLTNPKKMVASSAP